MIYSKAIDRAALAVAQRMFKRVRGINGDDAGPFSVDGNPLFYPCVMAFTIVVLVIASPLVSMLLHKSGSWLPSPIVVWLILVFCAYPVARFCTMLLALRSN